ncbi:hypothetical protein [Lysinibacillus sp. BW-2-10]|uniref:hypothetical protein n=1 Tax=Lysinibacillus sp. BW-2-10 TaxID=2590030 RepID=UPI00117C8D2D|nr:hypothetical protein [Lysinibacillus sp. BW-2-10]TSI05770.1 hypothetical protein FJQ64_11815 [Lysinibacillus sp. BW-2-10]
MIAYGKDHLNAFLNLPIKDTDVVMAGLKMIDYALDELLVKIKDEEYGYEILEGIPEEIAYSLVLNRFSNAIQISRITREYFNVNKRLSTGTLQRPYIYLDVVFVLMNEAEKGTLYFDKESLGIDDCYFYPSEEQLGINMTSTNNIQPSLF